MLRAVPASLDPGVVARIDRELESLARHHRVAIPWAIESGSRAWGFPSPDSDYDCRFFFVRAAEDYLTPWPLRDVLAVPIEDAMDLGGWDVRKAVRLLVEGNPTVVEWLQSPIVYAGDATFREGFLALAEAVADRQRFGRHYLHVARRHWDRAVGDDGQAKLKTVMYVLRAVACLRWLRCQPSRTVPPMSLTDLMAGAALTGEVREEIDTLLELKSRTREMGRGAVPTPLRDLIMSELSDAEGWEQSGPARSDSRQRADEFLRFAVRRFGPAQS